MKNKKKIPNHSFMSNNNIMDEHMNKCLKCSLIHVIKRCISNKKIHMCLLISYQKCQHMDVGLINGVLVISLMENFNI